MPLFVLAELVVHCHIVVLPDVCIPDVRLPAVVDVFEDVCVLLVDHHVVHEVEPTVDEVDHIVLVVDHVLLEEEDQAQDE